MLNVSLILDDGFHEVVRKDGSFLVPYNSYFTLSVHNLEKYPVQIYIKDGYGNIFYNGVLLLNNELHIQTFMFEKELDLVVEYEYQINWLSTSTNNGRCITLDKTTRSTIQKYLVNGYHVNHSRHCGQINNHYSEPEIINPNCKYCGG